MLSLKYRTLTRGILLVTLALATALSIEQIFSTQMLLEQRVSLDNYMDGVAQRPFAYRTLVPGILRVFDSVSLGGMVESAAGALRNFASGESFIPTHHPNATVWLLVVQTGFLFAYASAGSSVYSSLFPESRFAVWAAPLLVLIVAVIVLKGKLGHIYDFAVLFFMALLLKAMLDRCHVGYLVVFAVSCINKETTVLMTFAYAGIFFGKMTRAGYATMLFLQVIIFFSIYLTSKNAFAGNPGAPVEVWYHQQLAFYLGRPRLALAGISVSALILLWWHNKPEFLRRAMLMVPPHLVLCLYGAAPGELRNSYEVLPLLSIFLLRNAEVALGKVTQQFVRHHEI